MIRGGSYKGKPDSHIDPVVEIKGFHRNQRLIVIHADGGVIGRTGRGVEHRISGERAADVGARRSRFGDRRGDNVYFFPSHMACFACMGV